MRVSNVLGASTNEKEWKFSSSITYGKIIRYDRLDSRTKGYRSYYKHIQGASQQDQRGFTAHLKPTRAA